MNSTRIVGGFETEIGEYPWQVDKQEYILDHLISISPGCSAVPVNQSDGSRLWWCCGI